MRSPYPAKQLINDEKIYSKKFNKQYLSQLINVNTHGDVRLIINFTLNTLGICLIVF